MWQGRVEFDDCDGLAAGGDAGSGADPAGSDAIYVIIQLEPTIQEPSLVEAQTVAAN